MSKAKTKSTTKPLKAKAARKAEPKVTAFSRRRCEVGEIADDFRQLTNARWWLRYHRWLKANDAEKKFIRQQIDAVEGSQRGIIERAAQRQAFSAVGAIFQVMVLTNEVGCLAERLGGDSL